MFRLNQEANVRQTTVTDNKRVKNFGSTHGCGRVPDVDLMQTHIKMSLTELLLMKKRSYDSSPSAKETKSNRKMT